MIDENLDNEELVSLQKQYVKEGMALLAKARVCQQIRIARESRVMLATAQAAIDRAKSGVCSKGLGDCSVHQMGSCREAK